LQNELRRQPVSHGLPAAPAGVALHERALCRLGRQALIPRDERHGARSAGLVDEGERFLGLWPQRAVHILWQPDDDSRHLIHGAHLTQQCQVIRYSRPPMDGYTLSGPP
jgi:hypothetical protein